MRQVGDGKASVSESLMKCRNFQLVSEPGCGRDLGMSLAAPGYWSGGTRHEGDASPFCCSRMECGKACLDTAAREGWATTGRAHKWPKPRGVVYLAGHAFGPTHSSGEAPVMGAERRGRTVQISSFEQPETFREGSSERVKVD